MSGIAIRVEGLGKKYLLGHQKSGDLRQTFRQAISQLFTNGSEGKEEFWAVRDLHFEIRQGDVVGIIGRNGAGKSTLLKILSRITQPTTGRFEINGRVSSLLEVGTGFHFELTGRENIFLNGTILGMRRAEIRSKFDEIVAFSGVENFLDTPVKHYSSGMRVRLAFSIAAHLEPEILIIDEVLAVGDAEFQKKCLGKMDEVSKKEGRTILFVSHNLAAVENLCTNGILLEKGCAINKGPIMQVVSQYLHPRSSVFNQSNSSDLTKDVAIERFVLRPAKILTFDDLEYEIVVKSAHLNRFTDLAILIYNQLNERIGIIDLRHDDLMKISSIRKEFTVRGKIKSVPLLEGTYNCGLFVSSTLCQGDYSNLVSLDVERIHQDFVPYAIRHRGHVQFKHDFLIE